MGPDSAADSLGRLRGPNPRRGDVDSERDAAYRSDNRSRPTGGGGRRGPNRFHPATWGEHEAQLSVARQRTATHGIESRAPPTPSADRAVSLCGRSDLARPDRKSTRLNSSHVE